jgi:hypothetical protein
MKGLIKKCDKFFDKILSGKKNFEIRFMCECGTVSEKCYVDNVKVIAE